MDVNTSAASGQDEKPGNTGQNPLSDAISAAVTASESPVEEKVAEKLPEPSVDKTAGDKRSSEDASAAKTGGETKDKEAAADKGDAAPKFEAPKHWPEDRKQAFAALPQQAQEVIKQLAKDLEGGFTRKSQELSDKSRYADAVRGLIDEGTRNYLSQTGASEVQYFDYLNKLQQFAAKDGPAYVRWAMQSMGITPEHLGFHAQKPPEQAKEQDALNDLLSDPKVKLLEAELAQIKGRLSDRDRQELQAQQGYKARQQQQQIGVALQFRNALDDAGQLKYPHFDAVRLPMSALMESDHDLARMPDGPEKLQAAYDMAVWARSDLRSSLIEVETSKRVTAAQKAAEAERAKRVTAVKPANGVATQSIKPRTLDEIISHSLSQHGQ